MKVAVMQVALTVLGLVASSFAAPAVDGVSKQMNSRSEPVCIDMWQNPGRKDPIRLNYCNPQDQCIPWQKYQGAGSQRVDVGAMKFKGTCCQLFAFDDCNASSGSHDYFLTCGPGDVPVEWRSKVRSIECYLPGQFNWSWRHKRSMVKAAAAVPPLRFLHTTFEGHTIWLMPTKREEPVSNTVKPPVFTTTSIKPTSTIFDFTVSNTGRPIAPPATSLPIVKREHTVSNILHPTIFTTVSGVSYIEPTFTNYNITISNPGRPDVSLFPTLSGHFPNIKRDHYTTSTMFDLSTSGTVVFTKTIRIGYSAKQTDSSNTAPATVTVTETETIHAAEVSKPTTTTLLPWNLLPTSGWLSGSGSAITWSTSSHINITTGVSSVITAPTTTADVTTL